VDGAGVPTWSRCLNAADSAVISDQPFERDHNAMRDGVVQNLSTSLVGGGDRYAFYVSFDKIHNEGFCETTTTIAGRSARTSPSILPTLLNSRLACRTREPRSACRSATKPRMDCSSRVRAASPD
jgi:hypothetical protein